MIEVKDILQRNGYNAVTDVSQEELLIDISRYFTEIKFGIPYCKCRYIN